jgi:hypothetical protein
MEPPVTTNANHGGAPRAAAPYKGTSDAQPLRRESIYGATATPNAPACGVGLVTCEGCWDFSQ